jgi:DNA-binding MarR family transcriptional regulator
MGDVGAHALESALIERIGTHVKRIDQLIVGAKTEALRPLGVTVPQYAVLFAIAHLQPTSGAQLARAVLTTPQTMSTILTNLAVKDLIVRDVSAIHQKLLEVRLTPAGEELVKKCDEAALRIERDLRETIGEERFSSLAEIAKILQSAAPPDDDR